MEPEHLFETARADVRANLHVVGVDHEDKHVIKRIATANHAKWLAEHPEYMQTNEERARHAHHAITEAIKIWFGHLDALAKLLDEAELQAAIPRASTPSLKLQLLRDEYILHVMAELELRGIPASVAWLYAETRCISKAARHLVDVSAGLGEFLSFEQARYRLEIAVAEMKADHSLRRSAILLFGL